MRTGARVLRRAESVSIERQLAALVGEDNVLWGECSDITLDGQKPRVIVRPATSEEVAAVVDWARATDHALIIAGQGTRLALGNPPQRADVLLWLARMNRLLDYEPADVTAQVEAGCTLTAFNQTALQHRQWLPFDPPGSDQATLGGIVATDDFGPLRHAYGRPREYVIGVEVIDGTGRLIKSGGRVVKNVTGYDLNKLFVGSYGTLGVIVRINFKLRPRPEGEATVWLRGAAAESVVTGARALRASELRPVACVLVNGGAGRALGFDAERPSLFVRFIETEPAIRYQLDRLADIAAHHHLSLVRLDEARAARLWSTLASTRFLMTCEFILRLSVLPAQTDSLFTFCHQELSRLTENPSVMAYLGTGIVRASGMLPRHRFPLLADTVRTLRAMCRGIGGHLLVEAAPADIKRDLDVWGEVGPTISLMRGLKQCFDPHHLFNPGRFVAGI